MQQATTIICHNSKTVVFTKFTLSPNSAKADLAIFSIDATLHNPATPVSFGFLRQKVWTENAAIYAAFSWKFENWYLKRFALLM